MKKNKDKQPKMGNEKFVCPHCGVLSRQNWTNVKKFSETVNSILNHLYLEYRARVDSFDQTVIKNFCEFLFRELPTYIPKFISSYFSFSICQSCSKTSIWIEEEMIYPKLFSFPDPNEDLTAEIKKLYLEAANIFQDSPRASAALLRLSIEELCKQLGEKGDLNTSIGNLVKKGMNIKMQQALDYCRVIGNNAVHAGKIDLEDDPNKISTLFYLVNDIADEMITKPKEMQERYSSLPDGYKNAVAKRDGKTA